MEDTSRLYELMIGLGFDRVATEVYGVVLTCGPLARRGIVSVLPGLAGQVDDALTLLRGQGLIGSEYRRLRRHRFYAVAPHLAWTALGSELLWSTTDPATKRSPSPGATDPAIEARTEACHEIATVAGRLYRSHAAALVHREWDAATEEEFARLICESIAQARASVLAVSTSPRLPQVASFWATLTDRIGSGVSYRRIVDLDEVIDHGVTLVRRDIEEYRIDLRVLERDRIRHKFTSWTGASWRCFMARRRQRRAVDPASDGSRAAPRSSGGTRDAFASMRALRSRGVSPRSVWSADRTSCSEPRRQA